MDVVDGSEALTPTHPTTDVALLYWNGSTYLKIKIGSQEEKQSMRRSEPY